MNLSLAEVANRYITGNRWDLRKSESRRLEIRSQFAIKDQGVSRAEVKHQRDLQRQEVALNLMTLIVNGSR